MPDLYPFVAWEDKQRIPPELLAKLLARTVFHALGRKVEGDPIVDCLGTSVPLEDVEAALLNEFMRGRSDGQ